MYQLRKWTTTKMPLIPPWVTVLRLGIPLRAMGMWPETFGCVTWQSFEHTLIVPKAAKFSNVAMCVKSIQNLLAIGGTFLGYTPTPGLSWFVGDTGCDPRQCGHQRCQSLVIQAMRFLAQCFWSWLCKLERGSTKVSVMLETRFSAVFLLKQQVSMLVFLRLQIWSQGLKTIEMARPEVVITPPSLPSSTGKLKCVGLTLS